MNLSYLNLSDGGVVDDDMNDIYMNLIQRIDGGDVDVDGP
jgi:hypothetical protein